jgi:DNA polymerase III delta prime subunit
MALKNRMAPLDGQDSQRELQERRGLHLDGSGHEIYVDRAEGDQRALLEFLHLGTRSQE